MASLFLYQRPKMGLFVLLKKTKLLIHEAWHKAPEEPDGYSASYSILSISAVHCGNCYQLHSWHKWVTILSEIPVSLKTMVVN